MVLADDRLAVGHRSTGERSANRLRLRDSILQHPCVGAVDLLRRIHVPAIFERGAGSEENGRNHQNGKGQIHRDQIKRELGRVSIPARGKFCQAGAFVLNSDATMRDASRLCLPTSSTI